MKRLTLLETFFWHNNVRKDWETSILSDVMEQWEKMQVAAGQYVKGLLALGDDWESIFKNELTELNKFGNAEGKNIQQRINQFEEQIKSSLRLQRLNKDTERRLEKFDNILEIFTKQDNENPPNYFDEKRVVKIKLNSHDAFKKAIDNHLIEINGENYKWNGKKKNRLAWFMHEIFGDDAPWKILGSLFNEERLDSAFESTKTNQKTSRSQDWKDALKEEYFS